MVREESEILFGGDLDVAQQAGVYIIWREGALYLVESLSVGIAVPHDVLVQNFGHSYVVGCS